MKNWHYFKRFNRIVIVFITVTMVFLGAPASAVGPVESASLPGGVTVTDSDSGSGESWGRVGGRTISYESFALANFTALTWRPLTVGIAFDGEISAGLEEMSSPVLSGNTIQWTGETTIRDSSDIVHDVNTRFTLTVSEGISGPPFETNILASGGTLSINLLFEAKLSGSGDDYEPALDFFDVFDTHIEEDGKAITSFDSGFFYEVIEGMSIEEHDSNMQSRFNGVDGVLDYLRMEWNGRIPDIGLRVNDNNSLLQWISASLEGININLGELLNRDFGDFTTNDDINELFDRIRERISETESLLICMWVGDAFGPFCPIPGLPNLLDMQTDIATLADDIAEQNTVKNTIEVIAVKSQIVSSNDPVFIVLTKLRGLPTDATITSVRAVTESINEGIGAQVVSFSTAPVDTGLQQLDVELPNYLSSVKTLLIVVKGVEGDSSVVNGSVLVSHWE